jgi:ectoine hydroxylase-related dioxygenase (phytanoyl-CoA dioxygenase family)
MGRYTSAELDALADEVRREGHCVLRGHLPAPLLTAWNEAFAPLLARHVEREGHRQNRGAARYYVTLPFVAPWAEPRVFADDDVLALVDRLVGPDPLLVQLATDTPLAGSAYQDVHRDAPPLFPEAGIETPPFQLAVNVPLVPVTLDNGPLEVVRGTAMLPRAQAVDELAAGHRRLEPVLLALGDVIVRDVRTLHRGTPNHTPAPRPMVVVGYSRRWLYRPEVEIRVPRSTWDALDERARRLLRSNPVIDRLDEDAGEKYQAFAY